MSSFEDIETQNGRRLTIYGKSKVAGLYANHVRGYQPAFYINDEHARAAGVSGAGGSAALRRPRTALGFGLLGPVAPTLPAGGWLVYMPGGKARSVRRSRAHRALRG